MDLPAWNLALVYGGTFDPPHRAHVELPGHVARAIGADGVLYIPAGQPPHKTKPRTPAADRLAMLRLALCDQPNVHICTDEIERDGASYTVETLERLRRAWGERVKMRLLIGADMAMIFDQWRESQHVAELAEPIVMVRPPETTESLLDRLPGADDAVVRTMWQRRLVITPQIDISSTELRQSLRAGQYDGELVREMMDARVVDYARKRRVYER